MWGRVSSGGQLSWLHTQTLLTSSANWRHVYNHLLRMSSGQTHHRSWQGGGLGTRTQNRRRASGAHMVIYTNTYSHKQAVLHIVFQLLVSVLMVYQKLLRSDVTWYIFCFLNCFNYWKLINFTGKKTMIPHTVVSEKKTRKGDPVSGIWDKHSKWFMWKTTWIEKQ